MKLSPVRHFVLLFAVFILGCFLRFYQIADNPPSLTWDEVAWGYNAYSLGKYGEDEFGKKLPMAYIESFGDFKPPVYAYLAVIPVVIFGLNEFATRFPSALFGSLTVLISYFLVLEIFYKNEKKHLYAFFTALFLAVSPWHINLSRGAFEANVATFFIVTGVWSYLKAVRNTKWMMIVSGISFVLSMYTFNTARIVSPLLVFVLAVSSWTFIKSNVKVIIASMLVSLLLLLPVIPFLLSPQASLRFKEVNIFSDISVVQKANQNIQRSDSFIGKIVNNRRVFYANSYIKHYFDNLNPAFLFIVGDGNPKFSTRDVGLLYLWDFIFLLLGVLLLIRKTDGKWWLLPLWFVIGIMPAATARETPHALRIETTIPVLQIVVAYGFVTMLFFLRTTVKKSWLRNSIYLILILGLFLNVLYYLHGYYTHYPRMFSGEWQYGYKESVAYVKANKHLYDTIYITDKVGRPYIYYLFYEHTDPREFQKTADVEREVLGFVNVRGYDKYIFLRELPHETASDKTLFINTPESVPEGATILKQFKLLNGTDSFVAYII